jgi:peptidase S41-like protein/tricorn protease-like protein
MAFCVTSVINYDYSPQGMFLLFVDENGKLVKDPVKLTNDSARTNVLWNGTSFLVLFPSNNKLMLRKYSPTGEFVEELMTDISLSDGYGYLHCELEQNAIRVIHGKFMGNNVSVRKISFDGEELMDPINLNFVGGIERCIFYDDGFLALSEIMISDGKNLYFQLFDKQGGQVGFPTIFQNLAWSPQRSIHWNGSTFVCIASRRNYDGSVSVFTITLDKEGKQIGEEIPIGLIPYKGYYGKANFSSELIWTGSEYFAVWDQGHEEGSFSENAYARMLDIYGQPTSDALLINPEPLEQQNHGGFFTGDDFIVFTIAQGHYNPSIVFNRIKVDQLAPTFTPTPTPRPDQITPMPTPRAEQFMTFRAYIDGSDEVHIQDNRVWYVHNSYSKPGLQNDNDYPTYINDEEWKPTWQGDSSNEYEALSPPLPDTGGYYYTIKEQEARGGIHIIQMPNADNEYELVVYLNDDKHGAADWYEFTLAWSDQPYKGEVPLPDSPYILWNGIITGHSRYAKLIIQGDELTAKDDSMGDVKTISSIISNPIPETPVDLTGKLYQGGVAIHITQQPREENEYTAKVVLEVPFGSSSSGEIVVLLTWQDVIPEPTPTPWPAWSGEGSTPTPIGDAPKVLWNVMDRAFPDEPPSSPFNDSFLEFRNFFIDAGVDNHAVIAGSQPITNELLQGYAAVIFGDTRQQEPLNGEETASVVRYVRGGGSLFVMGQQDSDFLLEKPSFYATSITKPFGIEYSTRSGFRGYFTDSGHPLADGVMEISGGGSKLLLSSPAKPLAVSDNNEVLLAEAKDGYGKVIAYSDEYMFLDWDLIPENSKSKEKRQFAENMVSYLLMQFNKIPTATPTPVPTATFTPTHTPTVDPNATSTPTPMVVNLMERYPTDLVDGDADSNNARPWTFTVEDIYSLSQFKFSYAKTNTINIDIASADLGIGHCEDGAVWAIIIPHQHGFVDSSFLQETEGVKHIWMRFHPSVLNELFPLGTVSQNWVKENFQLMQRIADHKIRNCWQAGGKPMIPPPTSFNFDIDTEIDRRFLYIYEDVLHYAEAFEGKGLPDAQPVSEDKGVMFDRIWNEFDRYYAMFILRPEVDWNKMKEEFRPKAIAAQDQYKFAYVIADMLKPLRDLHVWFTVSGSYIPIYGEAVNANANQGAYGNIIGEIHDMDHGVQWGVTDNNIGFIAIHSWKYDYQDIPDLVDQALEELKDTNGLVVDVRYNGGGSEPLAQKVAGRFSDKTYTYAYSQYRNGANHDDLGEMNPRSFSPRGSWRYVKPVVCLIGQKCMSSNESFAKMMGQCPNVTLMGDRTRGSSGNPKVVQLPMNMAFSVPQWIDYLPDGTPLDEHGVHPDIWFEPESGAFEGQRDDLLQAALNRLSVTKVYDCLIYEN